MSFEKCFIWNNRMPHTEQEGSFVTIMYAASQPTQSCAPFNTLLAFLAFGASESMNTRKLS